MLIVLLWRALRLRCPNCGGKLWEYAIERAMVCEDCRQYWKPEEALAHQESVAEAEA